MNRRKFLKKSFLGVSILGIGTGAIWLKTGKGKEGLQLQATQSFLKSIDLDSLKSFGVWTPAQVFTHLAQSIEYSMSGYPVHKPKAFKNSIGSLAFKAFAARGEMSHNLDEPIPGADRLLKNNIQSALERLITSLNDFNQYENSLKPHFAYGELNKQEYTWAHIMHIENHFKQMSFSKLS